MGKEKEQRYWMRMLLNGRVECHWSNGDTHVHFFAEAKRATEVAQAMRDLHGGGPAEPTWLEPLFGRARPAMPHPEQTTMDTGDVGG